MSAIDPSEKLTHVVQRRTRPVRAYCGLQLVSGVAWITIREALHVAEGVTLCWPCATQSKVDVEIETFRDVARQRRQGVRDQLTATGLSRTEAHAAMRALERLGQLTPLLGAVDVDSPLER